MKINMDKNTLRLFQASQSYTPKNKFLEYVGSTYANNTSTLTTSSSIQINDIVIVTRYTSISGTTPPWHTTPSGFLLISSVTDITYNSIARTYSSGRLSTYYKVADVPGSENINIGANSSYSIVFRANNINYSSISLGGSSALTVGAPYTVIGGEAGSGSVLVDASATTSPVAVIAFADTYNGVVNTSAELEEQAPKWYLNTSESGGISETIGSTMYLNLSIFNLVFNP